MSAHNKARAWALAGTFPAIGVATIASDRPAGWLLIVAAVIWAFAAAVLAEHAWQRPTVKWLEHRNLELEQQLAATEAVLKAKARADVIDIRDHRPHQPAPSSDLARRVEAARAAERARLHAEPTAAEIDQAKADIVAAFEPLDTWGDPR